MKKFTVTLVTALLSLVGASFGAHADTNFAAQAAKVYSLHAKKLNPSSTVTAEAGRAFYIKKVNVEGKDLSCSACHTDNPSATGKHNESGKAIQPLAPSANPNRFSDLNKSEQAFSKHCKDLYSKDCSPQDKADFITYLLSVK